MNQSRLQSRTETIFEVIVLTILAIILALFINELRLLARDLRNDVNQTAAELHATLVTVNRAADQANIAATAAAGAAVEQRAYWNKTSLETYKTMASLRLAIVKTDISINSVLVPEFTAGILSGTQLSSAAAVQLTRTVDELRPTLANLAQASAAAAAAMADPAVHETFTHVDQTSLELAATARNMDEATASAARSANLIETRVRQATKPASLAARFGGALLGLTVKAAQIAGGFFK